jgi:hypothetical protein
VVRFINTCRSSIDHLLVQRKTMCPRIIKSDDHQNKPPMRLHAFPQLPAFQQQTGGLNPKGGPLPDASCTFKPHVLSSDREAAPLARFHPNQDQPGATLASAKVPGKSADIERLFSSIQQAVLDLDSISRKLFQDVENELGLLALRIGRLMVSHAARTNPEIVLSSLTTALKHTQELEILHVRLNPEDIAIVTDYLNKFPGITMPIDDLPLTKDPSIEPGGCLIETSSGIVDATHENQFNFLLEQFQTVKNLDPSA